MVKQPEIKFYNDARKYCPGCKRVRSLAQFKTKDSSHCNQCVLRGQDKADTADRAYQPSKTI